MTMLKKTLATIVVVTIVVGLLDLLLRSDEDSTCSSSSAEWCGEMYFSRLADAQVELASCQVQFPQGPHANHSEGCMHSLCDESLDGFTQWVFPANNYLLRRVELSDKDYELQVLLAESIGGVPEAWPLSSHTLMEMGY